MRVPRQWGPQGCAGRRRAGGIPPLKLRVARWRVIRTLPWSQLVGWRCIPNSVNVIAGKATFTIDLRGRTHEMLARGDEGVRRLVSTIAAERGLKCSLAKTEDLPVVHLDPGICSLLREAARRQGVAAPDVASGALHDTAILAPYLPAAMLFVASRGGISHNPAEYSRIEDIACAARIVAEAVRS